MKRWMKVTLICCIVILLLLLSTMLIVPWQVNKQGTAWIEANTERTLAINKVSFNPFTLTLEISGLALSEPQVADIFISFDRLMLSLSSRSLVDWALILDRVELDRPVVNLEQFAKQEFNFSDFTRLGDTESTEPEPAQKKPFHFSFNNIVISDGAIDFTDHTSLRKTPHTVRDLQLQVPFIGNIPYLTDEHVEPLLNLVLNGSDIHAEGQLKPFHQSVETSLDLLFDQIDLAYYAHHFPLPLPIEILSGKIDAELHLVYRISSTDQPKLLIGGELALFNLDVSDKDNSPLFKLPLLILDVDWAELFQRDINLLSLDIYEPQLFISRDSSGTWSFSDLLPAAPAEPEVTTGEETPPSTLLFRAEHAALVNGRVHFQDDFPPGGFREEIRTINLKLSNLSTHLHDQTSLDFSLQTARGGALSLQGPLSLQPLTADLQLNLDNLALGPHYPYLAAVLTEPLQGTLALSSGIEYLEDGNLLLQDAGLNLQNLVVPFKEQDRLTLQSLVISGTRYNLRQNQLGISAVGLRGGDIAVTRFADGSLSPMALLRTDETSKESANRERDSETEPDTTPLTLELGRVNIDGFDLQFTDASLGRQPRARIEQLDFSLENLHYPDSQQSPFRLNARVGEQGELSVQGTVEHTPLRLQAKTGVNRFPLADFNDFLPDDIAVSLKDGKLFSELDLQLEQQEDAFTGRYDGRLSITDFSLRDPLTDGEMLAWEGLGLDGIDGQLVPFALHVREVALSSYLANILIDRNGKINLTSVTASPEDQLELQEPEKGTASKPTEEAESGPPADIRIDALTLQGGTVNFTDRHLPSTFATTMYELGGRVSGMASDAAMRADVDLRGQLENHSPLAISGQINPLSEDLFADLTIRFEDIDLVPMTPYSGTYLGYAIDKGKLYLDLSYHIEQQQIDAQNRIMIDQFTFGESVESEQATSLPVGLAIALLKDQNGEIHLDVPVSGNLNDPSFSVAGTIFTILKNLLLKAATSPFSLLASMLGGEEDFTSVSFAAGLATISEADRENLAKLAAMLTQRPALTLEISAFVDPEQDPEGYRQEQLRQQLIAAQRAQVQEEGLAPDAQPVEISDEEYPELLTDVYRNAEFPRPRNFIGMLKDLPVPEMEKLLLANIIVGEEQLADLAKRRALQVRDVLVAESDAIKPQIFLKPTDIYQPPEEGTASRVEFGISSK